MPNAGITPEPSSLPDSFLRWLGHQRWLRYGLRNRVLNGLRDPERAPGKTFEVPFAGFVYPGRMNRWIDWIVYYYGAYELDELELMRALMAGNKHAVALDIGANVGHHSLYLASFCAEVHSFEPFDAVAKCLDEKIRRNALAHVHVHRVGLGEADAELDFFAPEGINTGTGTFVPSHEPENNRPAGRLRVVCADDYLAALQLCSVDLVKIDVEGFELSVLRGMQKTLATHRPVVMLELSDAARCELPDAAAFMALFPPGYEARYVRSQRSAFGLLGRRGCSLDPMQWSHDSTRGGYINLLIRPIHG